MSDPAESVLLGNLSDREHQLVHAARCGEWLTCSELGVDELATSSDPDHYIRAELIRELLIGRRGELDPRGLRLAGARIIDELDLDSVRAKTGLWLVNCALDQPIYAARATLPRLGLADVHIANETGSALDISGARIETGLYLKRVMFNGNGERGGINLIGAEIGGQLGLEDVQATNKTGPALDASGARINGGLFVRPKVRLVGDSEHGAINLIGAEIGGDFDLADVQATNKTGPALDASRTRINGGLFLHRKVQFEGQDGDGAIILFGARVGGRLAVGWQRARIEVQAGPGPLLDLREAVVGTTMALPISLFCPDQGRGDKCTHPQRVRLDEFAYAALGPEWEWRQWLHVIRCHTVGYHASAYQRLAAVERAAGHDGNARQILMAQQQDLYRRVPAAIGGRLSRLFHKMWGALAGYGYRARRTAASLLLALVVAGGLGWWAGQVTTRPGHHAAERVAQPGSKPGDPGTPTGPTGTQCSFIELVGLGLDRGLPLGLTGLRGRCDVDTEPRTGQAFVIAIWAVQLAVWGLATLALAGYTNLIRRTT